MVHGGRPSALHDLKLHWEHIYDISMSAVGWMAVLIEDRTVVLREDGGWALRMAIRDDYAQRAEQRRAAERAPRCEQCGSRDWHTAGGVDACSACGAIRR